MKNYKMAWRNLWRNRRRTVITAASVFFAVFFALVMRSLQLGSYDYMYKNVIESYSGYIQVQESNWWDEKILDNSFEFTDELENTLLENEHVVDIIPRIESFALASSGENTKGVMVMGIDPAKENLLSNISNKVVKYQVSPEVIDLIKENDTFPKKTDETAELFEGVYYHNQERFLMDLGLNPEEEDVYMSMLGEKAAVPHQDIKLGEEGAWIGDRLASYLKLEPGDTIVLMGQGYHGTTAAGKYVVKGLIKLPIPDLSASIVYLPYDIAQGLYNMDGMLTSAALHLDDNDDKVIEACKADLSSKVPEGTRVIDWKEMNDIIIQQMEADNISGQFMIGILYLVIGFGILGTVLMMTSERKREFGVLVAIGMQKKKLKSVMSWEMLYIGLLGIAAGMLISIPIILYGLEHPIVFKGEMAHMIEEYDMEPIFAFKPIGTYFLSQALVVGFMVLICLIHPLKKISQMKVVNALKA